MKTLMYIKRMLLGAVVAAIPVFIAACYGPVYSMSGYVTDSKTDEGIPGIEVTCVTQDYPNTPEDESEEITVYTNVNGYYGISGESMSSCEIVRAKDVDGSENGLYMRKTVYVNYTQNFNGDMVLKRLK